jgi:hypothetical protein
MGSAVDAVSKATKQTTKAINVGYRQAFTPGMRQEINRAAMVAQPVGVGGTTVGANTADNGGDVMAGVQKVGVDAGLSAAPVDATTPKLPPPVIDPAEKRRRDLAGRAGTLLTASGSGGGTNLGATGGRSTLLGL